MNIPILWPRVPSLPTERFGRTSCGLIILASKYDLEVDFIELTNPA